METKRLFLAIALSLLFIMVYSSLTTRYFPKQGLQTVVQPLPPSPPMAEGPKTFAPEQKEDTLIIPSTSQETLKGLQNDDLSLSIDAKGSGIRESKLKVYDTVLPQSNIASLVEWQGSEFQTSDATNGITMRYDDIQRGFEVKKSYRFTENKYILEMSLEFVSHSNTSNYVKYGLNVGTISEATWKKNPMDQRYFEISISLPNKTLRNNFVKFNPNIVDEKIQWIGIRDRYLCSIIRPLQPAEKLTKSSSAGFTSYILQVSSFELAPGQTIKHSYLIYLGPQKNEFISKLGLNAEEIINFGLFDIVSHILLGTLNMLFKLSKNWGIALILFSLAVFIVMSPLSIKSFSSMKKMQEIQPLMEELKVKYKDNPQKMHKEVMQLYKEKKINPLGGCLPLILQMPIFVALYSALMRFIDLKGAKFLWIKDLSEPDRLFVFSKYFPIIGRADKTGSDFNLLPVIMIITMLIQQKLTTGRTSQDPSTAQQQKMMSLFMSIFFGIIFYSMPAGLVLYWTVNSILMLLFQMRMFTAKT